MTKRLATFELFSQIEMSRAKMNKFFDENPDIKEKAALGVMRRLAKSQWTIEDAAAIIRAKKGAQ